MFCNELIAHHTSRSLKNWLGKVARAFRARADPPWWTSLRFSSANQTAATRMVTLLRVFQPAKVLAGESRLLVAGDGNGRVGRRDNLIGGIRQQVDDGSLVAFMNGIVDWQQGNRFRRGPSRYVDRCSLGRLGGVIGAVRGRPGQAVKHCQRSRGE